MSCAKKPVRAEIITPEGVFEGWNDCDVPQPICPRAGNMVRDDYELCITVCKQPDHAEMVALDAAVKAGASLDGAICRVWHWRCCQQCAKELEMHGVSIECMEVRHEPV